MSNPDPRTPAERDELLLKHFHRLNDVGQRLALVLLHTIAGNPAMQAETPPECPQPGASRTP